MSEPTTTTAAERIARMHSPEARRRAMKTRNGMSLEQKQTIAKEAVGKGGKELNVIAEKYGVSRSSVELWRKNWVPAVPVVPGAIQHGKKTSPAVRNAILARWRASGQPLNTWARENGYKNTTLRDWLGRKPMHVPPPRGGSLRPQGGGRERGRTNYTIETKRDIVERSRHEPFKAISAATGIRVGNIQRWRRELGVSKKESKRYGPIAPAVANGKPGPSLSVEDQALLEGHDQQKTRDKNLLEKVRRLEKENIVLKANLAYALDAGYLSLFDIGQMFTGKKG